MYKDYLFPVLRHLTVICSEVVITWMCSSDKMTTPLYFFVSLKFGVFYITLQCGEFRIKNATSYFHLLPWYCFGGIHHKICVFIIYVSFFDEVSNWNWKSCRWTQISLPFLSQILIRKVCVTDKIKYLEASQKFIFVLCRIAIRSTFLWKFGLTISKNFPSLQINAQINKLLNCLTSFIKSSSINWSGKATVFAKSICLFFPLISDFIIATNEKSKYNFLIKRLESLVAVIVR